MGIQSLELVCEKSVYYAGEVINGFCNVVVDSPVQMGVINMCFEGEANVHWTETRTESYTDSNNQTQTRTIEESYYSHEDIIDIHRDLVVSGGCFQPGTYSLPFSIPTPATLISTFEGFHGSIRYWLKAKKPRDGFLGSLFPHRTRFYICVLQAIDTNIPSYLFPVAGSDNKTVCCLCCASGPLTIEAKCDRAAYCPGDTAYITAHFDNKSSREVKPYCRLLQHQRYWAEGRTNFSSKKFDLSPVNDTTGSMRNLTEGATADWNQLAFKIPPCYPSNKCRIIEVSYYLEICMDIPMAFDLQVSLPVVLGTIPYRGPQVITQQPVQPAWAGVGAQTGVKLDSLPPPPITVSQNPMAMDAPPPGYFEAVFRNDQAIARAADENKQTKKA